MIKQVIVIRKDLNMRKGKIAAQVAHASMQFITSQFHLDEFECCTVLAPEEKEWFNTNFTKIVLYVNSEFDLNFLIEKAKGAKIKVFSIIDVGKTEFHGVPTLTCAAFGPASSETLDPITGFLSML